VGYQPGRQPVSDGNTGIRKPGKAVHGRSQLDLLIKIMNLAPCTKLGPYAILSLIGAGGMRESREARDTRPGRIVAIKEVKEPHSESFKQEARSIAALSHPFTASFTTLCIPNCSPVQASAASGNMAAMDAIVGFFCSDDQKVFCPRNTHG
jgi:serine/threonine protein kinase